MMLYDSYCKENVVHDGFFTVGIFILERLFDKEKIIMEKLMKTAKTVDTIFKVIYTILKVAVIITLVGIGISLAAYCFGVLPDTEVAGVTIGEVELIFREPLVVKSSYALLEIGVMMLMAIVAIVTVGYMIKVLRKVLAPMVEGKPFDGSVSGNIKKLGIAVIVSSVVLNLVQIVSSDVAFFMYDVYDLILSDNISKVMVHHEFSLSGILLGVLVIMLSYVFRYGEELQQQADETL